MVTGELPSVLLLGTLALIALWLTISRGGVTANEVVVRKAVLVAAITVSAQTVHFVEELVTGFWERFPAVFDLAPMSILIFVAFNLACLVIWALSAWGLGKRVRIALFPLWFLGIAAVLNGLAHPLLALDAGGYFPGLVTSPIVAVAGGLLLVRLVRVTQ